MIAVPASFPRPGLVPSLVALVFFMQLLDSTIIATSLPAMAADFGVEPVTMSVGITIYLLALAAVIPAAGWLGERWGARRVLVVSVALFTVASLACARAPDLWSFVAARIVQGAAAALMAPVGRMLVLGHAPKSQLMSAIATITWPALFAPVVGPILGAWITETVGWQWNFLINLPLGVGALAAFLLLVPDRPSYRARPFDGAGFALCSLSLLGSGPVTALVFQRLS
jgi:MFS family permease